METALFLVAALSLQAATVSPPAAPASGHAEVLLTLDAAGAVHLSARSASGTACEVVDRVRGPFASAGAAGSDNCELDLLLDAGQYKVRLESPARGKGQVTVKVTPFTELNAAPVRLVSGAQAALSLKPGQQASFWLSLSERQTPYVRVAGRHAGEVRLWRSGQWLEPQRLFHQQVSPTPGQPIHEWWVDSPLEAGDYQLVVYGRDSTTVTNASVDDALTLEYGFQPGSPSRTLPFTLGPSGLVAVQVPHQGQAAVLSLDGSPTGPVQLQAFTRSLRAASTECRVEKGALVPECGANLADEGQSSLSLLVVRGPPGTHGVLEWAPWWSGGRVSSGGYYGPATAALNFTAPRPGGSFLVGATDLPVDNDAPPLGCQLEALTSSGDVKGVVARAALRIDAGQRLEKPFNFPSEGATVWFEVGGGGSLLQRSGLTSRSFEISVSGKGSCEVYRMGPTGQLQRLTMSKPEGAECKEVLALEPGFYQLQLPAALSGIRTLVIAEAGVSKPQPVVASGACTLGPLSLTGEGAYRLVLSRVGAVRVRALQLAALPLAQTHHLTLDAKQQLTFPVAPASPLVVRAAAGAPFACTSQKGTAAVQAGSCQLPAGADTLTVSNPGTAPINLTFFEPPPPAPVSAPTSFSPAAATIPSIALNTPTFFDFERGQTRSVTFEVDSPGLYHVTTQGLLSTSCSLRTPAIDGFAANAGAGRGRNCLIQTWLQKGRYLLTATAQGQSQGRAALLLTRRNATAQTGLGADGDAYFRVDANELVQQKLAIKTDAVYQVATSTQGGANLGCRLDDADGWPLVAVPTSCTGTHPLRTGTWLWTQLPLTVESMRHTHLAKVREPLVLKGNAAHPVDFFTTYRAELGADGKDEFLFTLEGEAKVDVVLTNGMQGRISLLEKDRPPKPVEVVPALETGPTEEAPAQVESEEPPRPDAPEGESEGGGDGEGAPSYTPSPSPAVGVLTPQPAPPPPAGVKVTLKAGRYQLITEHSRGDVGIDYTLHLGTAALLPGMTRELPTPSKVPVLVPKDGTLRVRTAGDADLRCRLFDEKGALVFEGADNGSDWNCALAEPVRKGTYTLVLESETQQAGTTRLTLAQPPTEDLGPIADGAKVTLDKAVATWRLPVAEKDAVQEVTVRALGKTPLSCALEDPTGAVAQRRSRVSECALLVRPKLEQWRVRAWTTDGVALIQVAYTSRPIAAGNPGSAPAGGALTLSVPRAGRYKTGAGLFCIAGGETGVLRPCGPEASLEAGSAVFTAVGPKAQPLALDEVTAAPSDSAQALGLARVPFIQRLEAPRPSLFLLSATVQHGERAAPSCAFDGPGTVRERRETTCHAVGRLGQSAIARLWAPVDGEVAAQVVRAVATLPDQATPLQPGHRSLKFSGGVGRFALAAGARTRVELVVPTGAWAVLLDEAGAALDLCAPSPTLRRCLLTGQGGSVAIVSRDGQADATAVTVDAATSSPAFSGLYEDSPRQPGSVRLTVPAADAERVVTVEGALRCTLALADGVRLASCKARLPARQGAELLIEHDGGALRAMVHAPGKDRAARLGVELGVLPGPALPAAVAVPVTGPRVERTLVVDTESVVRVVSDAGVCGLFRGNELLSVDGLDAGCELVRVLAPGTYRLVVRPFAGRPLAAGALRWTAERVTQLVEGVGPETWLAPGDVRLYRFEVSNAGKVGLGVQAASELLDCAVYNDGYQLVGEGCHQYLSLEKGRYLLTVRNPAQAGAVPRSLKPVLLGLTGEKDDIPDEYLQDLFRRAGVRP